MPTISGGDLALLRQQHRAKFYLTPHPATVLWSAQVAGAHARESVSITFDGGTGANFNAITAGMELWIGTTAGAYDVDRVRIKSVSSGDGGVTGTVTISLNSVVWADNQHLTFIGWFLIKPRKPDIANDGTFLKDGGEGTGGIAYTDQNSEPTPVCIAGENRADFLDPDTGTWVIASQLPSSYAIAQGATISSYGASLVYGPDTPAISINSGTGVGTITFDTTGLYWIAWSCTDSNGKSQTTYRYYYAHSTDPQSVHYPFTRFSVNNVQGQWNNDGWSAGISVHGDVDLDTIPDHSPCIVWSENWYGVTKKNITFLPDQSGTVINGYIRRDKFSQDIEKGAHTADFSITTIQGSGDNKYNFSVSLEASQSVDTWWKYPSWITPTRAVHHFFKWHSTLLEVADVIGLNANTDGDSHVEFPDGSLLERANGALAVIRSRLVCDNGSRVHFVEDIQLRPDSERSGLGQVQEITNLDKNGPIDFVREQEKRVPFVYLAAFDYDGGFEADGKPQVFSRCAIAPGNNPYDDGPQPATEGKQIVTSQDHANEIVGRFLHAANNEYPEVPVSMVGRLGVLPIHLSEFWELTLSVGDTARRITKTLNLILRNVTAAINVQQGTVACTATFEAEANGPAGIAIACPSYPDLPDTDFEIPDAENDLGGALATASSLNYLPPQTKSWDNRSAKTYLDAYADPFWHTKQNSEASKDAILWGGGVEFIERTTDAGQNWTDVTPPNLATGVAFIRGDPSYIVENEHVWLGTWQDGGTWFSRLYITSDDGASWAEQDVGAGTQFGTPVEFDPIANLAKTRRRHIVALDSTRFAVVFTGDLSHGRIVVGEISGSTVAFGSSVEFMTTGIDCQNVVCTALDSSHVLISFRRTASGPTVSHRLVIANISGTTVSSIGTDTTYTVNMSGFSLVTLSSSKAVLFGFDNTGQVAGMVVNVTGDVIDSLSSVQVTSLSPNNAGTTLDAALLTTNTCAIGFRRTVSSRGRPHAVIATISGDTITYGTAVEANSTSTDNIQEVFVAIEDANEFILFYKMFQDFTPPATYEVRARHADVSGTVITYNAEQALLVFTDDDSDFTPDQEPHTISAIHYSGSTFALHYRYYDFVLDENEIRTTFIDVGITGSMSVIETINYTHANLDIGNTASTGIALVGGKGVVTLTQNLDMDGNPEGYVMLATSGGGELKALGLSLGKGLGEIAYITGWDGTNLVLMIYSLPGLVLFDNIALGTATEGEVNANTWIARPYSPFGSDQACYAYGRMDDPLATGTVHILITEDEGLSFVEVEQGWGTNHAGALLEDFGRLMVVRNLASSSKLYVADVGNPLKIASTLPFAAQVNPQAMAFSWLDGALFIGSGATDDVMVVVSPEPAFTRHFDLTFDHPTANGIRSIIVL